MAQSEVFVFAHLPQGWAPAPCLRQPTTTAAAARWWWALPVSECRRAGFKAEVELIGFDGKAGGEGELGNVGLGHGDVL